MTGLPNGMATFLFTDIEESTRLWDRGHATMATALARHDGLPIDAFTAHRGEVFKTVGDAFCVTFATALQALAEALAAEAPADA